jgi:hypothetical protein
MPDPPPTPPAGSPTGTQLMMIWFGPGTTGSVTRLANIPAQPLGSVALVMKVFNSATPGGAASAPFTFNNVAALSTPLSAPTNLRVVP